MTRVPRLLVLVLAVALIVLSGIFTATGEDSPTDLIAQADFAFMTRHLQESMTQAISLFEAVLPSLDTLSTTQQAYVLNRLAQLYYELTSFAEGDTPEDRILYEQGKAYGLQSLRLNAEFAEAEDPNFEEAVSYVTDAAALLWTADNWGVLLNYNPIIGLFEQDEVQALFRQSVEVDPEYWGGSSSNALGSLLIMSPSTMGGDEEAGLALVESAIEIDMSYLPNHVVLAEYWGFTYNFFGQLTGIRDAELIERELNLVLDAEIGDWPFWNRQAKKEAEELLAQLAEMQD